jgi:hypothetical protein
VTEKEKFLEWVDTYISTYEDAPTEVKSGAILVPISMLKELRELVQE